ncbi:MAG: hypothetical protein PVH41_05035, partial [Anaerolineae bacterium]
GIIERGDYAQWQAQGSKTLGERAAERVDEILAQHRPTPLPEAAARKVAGIVQRAAVGEDPA